MRSMALLALVSGLVALDPRVDACRGCFNAATFTTTPTPRAKTAQVVTDHRMVLSLSSERTTLWDQIRYAGSPDDFVWVLPIAPDADLEIGLADNAFVDALDSLSAPSIRATATSLCPSAGGAGSSYGGGYGGGCGGGASRSVDYDPGSRGSGNEGDAAVSNPGDVVGRESAMINPMGVSTVGPYAVTVLTSRGAGGFDEWMAAHHYDIPPATRAAVEHYQSLDFDFLVLRLRPESGIQQMQPIRGSVRGYVPTLPLRMIAAGVADKVGLTLMVLAPSGVQVANFRNAFIPDERLVFDFATGRSNYRSLFDETLRSTREPSWIVESSEDVTAPMMNDRMPGEVDAGQARTWDAGFDGGVPTVADPMPIGAFVVRNHRLVDTLTSRTDGGIGPSDPYVDRRVAFANLPGSPRLTRLRTELDRVVLDRDLTLEPATYWSIPQVRQAVDYVNPPPCPGATTTTTTTTTTTAPRGPCGCSAAVARRPGVGLFGFSAALYALRRWRRRTPAPRRVA